VIEKNLRGIDANWPLWIARRLDFLRQREILRWDVGGVFDGLVHDRG
jgi:hypothetical protein